MRKPKWEKAYKERLIRMARWSQAWQILDEKFSEIETEPTEDESPRYRRRETVLISGIYLSAYKTDKISFIALLKQVRDICGIRDRALFGKIVSDALDYEQKKVPKGRPRFPKELKSFTRAYLDFLKREYPDMRYNDRIELLKNDFHGWGLKKLVPTTNAVTDLVRGTKP